MICQCAHVSFTVIIFSCWHKHYINTVNVQFVSAAKLNATHRRLNGLECHIEEIVDGFLCACVVVAQSQVEYDASHCCVG